MPTSSKHVAPKSSTSTRQMKSKLRYFNTTTLIAEEEIDNFLRDKFTPIKHPSTTKKGSASNFMKRINKWYKAQHVKSVKEKRKRDRQRKNEQKRKKIIRKQYEKCKRNIQNKTHNSQSDRIFIEIDARTDISQFMSNQLDDRARYRILMSQLMLRDINPEDYDMLLKLDEWSSSGNKNATPKHVRDSLEKISVDELRQRNEEYSEMCPICMSSLLDPSCLDENQSTDNNEESISKKLEFDDDTPEDEQSTQVAQTSELIVLPRCNHVFHADCILRSLEYGNSCPICKTMLVES